MKPFLTGFEAKQWVPSRWRHLAVDGWNYLARNAGINGLVAVVCLLLIGLNFSMLVTQQQLDRHATIEAAIRQNSNLALALQEQTIRTLKGGDQVALFLRAQYAGSGARVDIARHMQDGVIDGALYATASVVNGQGDVIASNRPAPGLNYADRDFFRFHQKNSRDDLFVGKPVAGPGGGVPQIPFTRRLNGRDGGFAGLVMVNVNPAYFIDFYSKADLGSNGLVDLIGLDGVSRARRTGNVTTIGDNMEGSELLKRQATDLYGSFITSAPDGVERFVSYRTIPGYPLAVAVGTSRDEVLADFEQRTVHANREFALGSSFILLLGTMLIFALTRRRHAIEELAAGAAELRATFNSAPLGIARTDREGTFLQVNQKLCDIFGYTSEELLKLNADNLTHPTDRGIDLAQRGRLACGEIDSYSIERRGLRKNGSVVWLNHTVSAVRDSAGSPLYFVRLIEDVTERRRAEETQALLAAIVENSNDAIVGRRLDGTITSWNAAAERLYGYTAAEMIGTRRVMVAPGFEREIFNGRALIGAGKMIPANESVRVTKDGRHIHVSRSVAPIKDAAGRTIGMSAIIRDISEQKIAEEMRAQLAAIVENSNDAIVSRNLERKIVTWNAAAEKLFGYSAAEAIGRDISMIVPPDKESEVELMRDRLMEGIQVPSYDTVRVDKSGRRIDVAITQSAIRGPAGDIIGVSLMLRDITAQKAAQSGLRLAASVFEGAAEGIMVTDIENRIVTVNRAFTAITGYASDEVIGQTPPILKSSRQPPEFYQQMRDTIRKYGRWQGELWDSRKNDEPYYELLSVNSVYGEDGSVTHYCAIFSDITRRKFAETELERLNAGLEARVAERSAELQRANRELQFTNRELEAFSYSISHDLRAPLRSIMGFGNFIAKKNAGRLDPESTTWLNRILAAAERMGELIDDLLDLSRITRAPLRRTSFDLSVVAKQIATALADSAPGRRARFEIEPDLKVDADAGLVRIALENLMSNAWKFSSKAEETVIRVGASTRDGQRVFFVADNGAGFDMKYAPKLFMPFQRLHAANEFTGTGVGLSIVQRIITRHDGLIWAESAPGEGATFCFTLGGAGALQLKAAG